MVFSILNWLLVQSTTTITWSHIWMKIKRRHNFQFGHFIVVHSHWCIHCLWYTQSWTIDEACKRAMHLIFHTKNWKVTKAIPTSWKYLIINQKINRKHANLTKEKWKLSNRHPEKWSDDRLEFGVYDSWIRQIWKSMQNSLRLWWHCCDVYNLQTLKENWRWRCHANLVHNKIDRFQLQNCCTLTEFVMLIERIQYFQIHLCLLKFNLNLMTIKTLYSATISVLLRAEILTKKSIWRRETHRH